jgi:predicted helicase
MIKNGMKINSSNSLRIARISRRFKSAYRALEIGLISYCLASIQISSVFNKTNRVFRTYAKLSMFFLS